MKTLSRGLGRTLAAFAALIALGALAPASASPITYNTNNYGPRAAQLCDFPAQCPIDSVTFGTAGQSFKLEEILLGQGFSATMFTTDGAGGPGAWSFFMDLGVYASHLQSLPTGTSLLGSVLRVIEPLSLFMQTDAKNLLFDATTPVLVGATSLPAWVSGDFNRAASAGALNFGAYVSGDSQPVASSVPEPGSMALAGLALVAVVLSRRCKAPA